MRVGAVAWARAAWGARVSRIGDDEHVTDAEPDAARRSIETLSAIDATIEHLTARLRQLEAGVIPCDGLRAVGGTLQRYAGFISQRPAGWWQATKECYAPRWFLCRWPVRYVFTYHAPRTMLRQERRRESCRCSR